MRSSSPFNYLLLYLLHGPLSIDRCHLEKSELAPALRHLVMAHHAVAVFSLSRHHGNIAFRAFFIFLVFSTLSTHPLRSFRSLRALLSGRSDCSGWAPELPCRSGGCIEEKKSSKKNGRCRSAAVVAAVKKVRRVTAERGHASAADVQQDLHPSGS